MAKNFHPKIQMASAKDICGDITTSMRSRSDDMHIIFAAALFLCCFQNSISARAGSPRIAINSEIGDLTGIMTRVYLTELYQTPTDIPSSPSPLGAGEYPTLDKIGCYHAAQWHLKMTSEIAARQTGQPTETATGKSGNPLWPYRCRPIAVVSAPEDLNDQKIVFAIPNFIPADSFVRRMAAFQQDPESTSKLMMDLERQIEIFAHWVGRPDASFDYQRRSFKEFGWTALDGHSYDIDRRTWKGEIQGFGVSNALNLADWNGNVKITREGAFHLLELRSKRFKYRF